MLLDALRGSAYRQTVTDCADVAQLVHRKQAGAAEELIHWLDEALTCEGYPTMANRSSMPP